MSRIVRGGIVKYFGILGGLTTLTGIYLLWRLTGGFDPVISASRTGMVFGIGGVAGILATILAGALVGRAATKAGEAMEEASKLPAGAARDEKLRQVVALRRR
jgi:hypothetical protein